MRRLSLLLLFVLAACSQQGWNEKLTTPQERAQAVQVIALLRANDVDALRAMADAALAPQLTRAAVTPIAAMVPREGQPVLQTVSANTTVMNGETRSAKALNFELGAGERWAVIQVVLDTSRPPARVDGFRVFPFNRQPSRFFAFTLEGKSAIHYSWLAAMVLAMLVTLAGLVTAVRSPRFRKLRWLWAIGSLASFVSFTLNWSTGVATVTPISIMLFGAMGIHPSPLDPWIMGFAIPVVAIVILALAWRDRRRRADENYWDSDQESGQEVVEGTP